MIGEISNFLDSDISIVSTKDFRRIHELQKLDLKLSYVDCELIVICEENNAVLFSDDTRLINVAQRQHRIRTHDLSEILIGLKNRDRISKDDINEIVILLEKRDHYKFSKETKKILEE